MLIPSWLGVQLTALCFTKTKRRSNQIMWVGEYFCPENVLTEGGQTFTKQSRDTTHIERRWMEIDRVNNSLKNSNCPTHQAPMSSLLLWAISRHLDDKSHHTLTAAPITVRCRHITNNGSLCWEDKPPPLIMWAPFIPGLKQARLYKGIKATNKLSVI